MSKSKREMLTSAGRRFRVLLVEVNPANIWNVSEALLDCPDRVLGLEVAGKVSEARELLASQRFDAVLLDLESLDADWKDALLVINEAAPDIAVVLLACDKALAAEAVRLGAQDGISRSEGEFRQLGRRVGYAIERKRIENRLRQESLEEERERQDERERIGMDLHDGITQDVYGISLTLELALADIEANAPARPALERAIDRLHRVMRDMRSYIFDLRPKGFDSDLGRALQELAGEFQENSQIETKVELEGDFEGLNHDCEMALYHIAHEALSNARKHARPSLVVVSLSNSDALIRLAVRDDGAGFDAALDLPERHRGMRNMQSRAAAIGAEFAVISEPGGGTVISVAVPLAPNLAAIYNPKRKQAA